MHSDSRSKNYLKQKKVLRIFVDHGEAYGNLGDEMMLISALRRLEHYLGARAEACEFILPAQGGKPLPRLAKNVKLVSPPHLCFRFWNRLINKVLRLGRFIPLVRTWLKKQDDSFAWRLSARVTQALLTLYRIRLLCYPGGALKALAQLLRECDVFYAVGAADFNDYNLPGLAYKCWLYRMVRPWVKVSVVSAQGLGPLKTAWALKLSKQAFGKADLLSFRDSYFSSHLINRLHPQHVRYNIVGDEAFSLAGSEQGKAVEFMQRLGIGSKVSFIAFHFRMKDYTQDTRFLIPHIASVLDEVCKEVPYPIVFFPMSYHTHSTFDQACGWTIRETVQKKNAARLILAPLCNDVGLLKKTIGLARYSLGLSYHLHLASLSQGHPALVLYSGEYYRYKSEGLVGFYGPPNVALDVQKVSPDEVIQALKKIESKYEDACLSIRKCNQKIARNNDWTLEEMVRILKN